MRKVLIISLAVIFFMSCAKKENVAVQGVKLNIAEKDSVFIKFKEGVDPKDQQVYSDAIYATLIPFTASNRNITWSSEDPSIANVQTGEKGECLLQPAGIGVTKVKVTTEDGGKTAECVVKVTLQGVILTSFQITVPKDANTIINVGETIQAEVKFVPETNKNLTWSSSNDKIVTVTQKGLITGIAGGQAILTATPEATPSKFRTCTISVISDHYVDEYNVDHGTGVDVDGTFWATVNCGYNEKTFPYGKLYQWGRKDGQGQDEYQTVTIDTLKSGASPKKDLFYKNWNETFAKDDAWGYNAEEARTKTDPCPLGWRVPTKDEMDALVKSGKFEEVFKGNSVFAGNRDTLGKASSANLTKVAYMWTSTPAENNSSAYIFDSYGNDGFFYDIYRGMGCAVRCVRDNE